MSGKIFINYRREDSAASAGRLYDRLELEFDKQQLFIDVDHIAAGADFTKVLDEQVSQCDIMLSIIGKVWLDVKDMETGQRRLDYAGDFVRIEIAAALARDIHIIPVLVDGADMPREESLPDSLKPLSRRNAVRITHERFRADGAGLIKGVKTALEQIKLERTAEQQRQELVQLEAEKEARQKAKEQEQKKREQARLDAIAGLSPEEISKAEELANWDFIKGKSQEQLFRDHMARFPDGVTYVYANSALEEMVWLAMGSDKKIDALEGFMIEFPDGEYVDEAAKMHAELFTMEKEQAASSKHEREKAAKKEERKAREDAVWQAVKDSSDAETIKTFLNDWPGGAHAVEARRLQKALKRGLISLHEILMGVGAIAIGAGLALLLGQL